jgi:hypothetical protein
MLTARPCDVPAKEIVDPLARSRQYLGVKVVDAIWADARSR